MSEKMKRSKITTTMIVDSNGRETFKHEVCVNWNTPRTAGTTTRIVVEGGDDELDSVEEMANDLLSEVKRVRALVSAHSKNGGK